MTTKNLGQVAGVFIGTTPPENITLIWYDSTPNQMLHKVYDVNLAQWVVLDKNTISSITYSELVNLATTVGLSIGAWFKITDRGNSLALAITSTKVQYDDVLGNILIDDLGTNVQYHVTSSNLSIDDVIGVFDVVNKKLVFQFNEQTPDYTADDYILGKVKRNNIWSLAKYKLSSFLSKDTGNSITWNGGFFFNFNNAIRNILDRSGGVVAKDTYDVDLQNLNAAINNVGEENQAIIENAQTALTQATTDTAIYNKKVPTDLITGGEPLDVVKNDTLHTAISKIQRWINRFKYATGIRISADYIDATSEQSVNNNDNVQTAIGKLQYRAKNVGKTGRLSSDWQPQDYTGSVSDIAAGDTLDTAFAKAQAKLNQIGDISNGRIQSKAIASGSTRKTIFDLASGQLTFNRGDSGNNVNLSSNSGLSIKNGNNYGIDVNGDGAKYLSETNTVFDIPVYEKGMFPETAYGGAAAVANGKAVFTGAGYVSHVIMAALSAVCDWNGLTPSGGYQVFDAYFGNFKAGGISFGIRNLSTTDVYLDTDCTIVSCVNTENKNVFLPADPHDGQFVIVNQVNSAGVTVWGNGRRICDDTNVDSVAIGAARSCAIFFFNPNIATDEGYKWGMWVFERWKR